MSAIAPNTNLTLIKLPIELSDTNQLTFTNATAQHTYFDGITGNIDAENFTYQRRDSVIRYPALIDDILEYNYCMYQNNAYDSKWFYAFIEKMEYVNDNLTLIYIRTDVFQTWQFNLTYLPSMVEREHVNVDRIGLHTQNEGIATGDYIAINFSQISEFARCSAVLATTCDPDTRQQVSATYNGIPTACKYYRYRFGASTTAPDIINLRTDIQSLVDNGKSDAIIACFLAPNELTGMTSSTTSKNVPESYSVDTFDTTIDGIDRLGGLSTAGYVPRNRKLLQYPYCYVQVTNGVGGEMILKQDLWDITSTRKIRIEGVLSPGCSIVCYPLDYAGKSKNIEYGIPMAKYPELSWQADLYTNWQVENGLNVKLQKIQSYGQVITGSANLTGAIGVAITGSGTGDFTGSTSQLVDGLAGYARALNSEILAERVPPQFGGTINSGDVLYAGNNNTFNINYMTIKKEYAQIIDKYFDVYGYQVNDYKIPNITGRTNWNFIKCADCNIHALIPEDDLREIKMMFKHGVTLWHTTTHFLDYSQTNNIV